jgi:hypothetical protein
MRLARASAQSTTRLPMFGAITIQGSLIEVQVHPTTIISIVNVTLVVEIVFCIY